ncbi:hypothetical protein KAW18_18105 [candidate division WOR-3 bacterium]|nr:hypothetical protein [candidate division WOR-3 bacterium]
MTENRQLTPLWLATYIFIFGWTALAILIDAFIVMACEHEILYIWYYGLAMCAITAIPWVWYFTYLGHRYFEEIPRMWYILIFAPLLDHIFGVLSMKTVCSHIFILNGQTYYSHIGADNLLYVALISFMLYEVFGVWQKRLANRNLYIL